MTNVTQLREGAPTLMDIPGRLRQLADAYESEPDDLPQTFVWVEYNEDGSIDLGAFGMAPPNKAQVVGILALAQRHFDHTDGDLYRGEHAVGELAPVVQLRGNTMKMRDPDDTGEGGVPSSSPAPVQSDSKPSSKSWMGYAVGALILATLIYLLMR